MKTYFIEEIENELNVTKRQIYLYIRRQGFLKKFGLKKMADLEDKPRNGSISKVLTEDMYHYLKSKLSGEHGFRKSDDDVKDVVYLVQLHFGFVMKDDEGNEQRRYKLGFTSKWLHSRESNMKVTNPEARVVEYWKMSRSDEQTLFKYVNGVGCNRIG
ncbi:MAG: hypothetical protein KAG61_09165, partial [Bacteriovoracaceae bacterium]|nr:hypothetical protein [Bacteriovoracaceae bacterium]